MPGLHGPLQAGGARTLPRLRPALSSMNGGLRVGAGHAWLAASLACVLLPVLLPSQGLPWDVPERGAHVYERTSRWEVSPPPSRLKREIVVADGDAATPHTWRHWSGTEAATPTGFEQPAFDDSPWPLGSGEFHPEVDPTRGQRTRWADERLCLRTHLELPKKPKALLFVVDHDDHLRIWLNGRLLVADDGYGRGRRYLVTGPELDAWQRGDNVLAVQCTNIGGAQCLDVELAAFSSLPPGARSGDELQRLLADEREAAAKVQRELFGAFRPPALLLHGDLDGAGQAVRQPPADLRDLLWFVAMDLQKGVLGGAVQQDLPRLFRLGDLQLRGKVGPVDPDGWQSVEVTWKSAEPTARGDSKRFLDQHVKSQMWYGTDGELRLRRRLELKDGRARVTTIDGTARGRFFGGKNKNELAATFDQQEHWQLQTTRHGQDAEFRKMVGEALQRGTARLREQLERPTADNLAAEPADGPDSYHSGRLAIGLLALLKGGVPKDDPVVQRGFAELRKRPLIDSYSLANAIMAIEALYIPASESADLRAGTIDRPRPRTPSAADKALLEKWTTQLLRCIDTRTDLAYLLRFNYTGGERFDNSVNQYGLLGMYSAHLCGIAVKPSLWEAAANHLLQCQGTDGAKVELALTDYRTWARRLADPDAAVTSSRSNQKANGWTYHEMKDNGELRPVRGSMTCAGITGLAICRAAIQDQLDMKRPKLLAESDRARADGFAWLAQHLSVRHHPGELAHQQQWFYYYLYGLERAASLSGVALIQDRDWYFEGAMVLVLAQLDDGNWPGEIYWDAQVERNAMAILFLKQSTAPVLTGK